jgi:hypothetical protein
VRKFAHKKKETLKVERTYQVRGSEDDGARVVNAAATAASTAQPAHLARWESEGGAVRRPGNSAEPSTQRPGDS